MGRHGVAAFWGCSMGKALRSWRLLVGCLVLAKVALVAGCGGGGGTMQESPAPTVVSSPAPSITSPPPSFEPGQIPASFFGMHGGDPLSSSGASLQVRYGEFRNLGSTYLFWPFINTCNAAPADCQANPAANSSFDFSNLDTILANVKTAGVNDILFTLSYTPAWAAAYAAAPGTCVDAPTACVLPPDINPDGSGANAVWDNWVEHIAAHVNDPTWLETHAHIKYWEPWNEIFQDPLTGNSGPVSLIATYAQNLRLIEDTRCLILGVGTIHNYPSAGSSTACSTYLTAHGNTAIDPNAKIVLSSQEVPYQGDFFLQIAQNYLYCNNSPHNDNGSSTTCTWSGGLNWLANAVDIMNWHMYVTSEEPEADLPAGSTNNWIQRIRAILAPADLLKPLWNGEGSCGLPTSVEPANIWGDDYSMAGFVPRYAALLWSAGVTENFWYKYDRDPTGTPFCPFWDGSSLTPAGVAWNTTYNWLVGAKPVNTPFCSNAGTVWTCALTEANGTAAEVVWDSQFGPGGTTEPANCSTASNPLICGDTPYSVPSEYGHDWVDIGGTVHPFQATVTLGAVPILLE